MYFDIMSKRNITIRLPSDILDVLSMMAKNERRSISQMVEMLIVRADGRYITAPVLPINGEMPRTIPMSEPGDPNKW